MSPAMIGALVIGYLLLSRPAGSGGSVVRAPSAARPVAGGTATPAGTFITLPGIGSYQNIYGGGVSVALDPNLFKGLFGRPAEEPDYERIADAPLASPTLSSGYVPEADVYAPIEIAAPTTYPYYAAGLV